MPENQPTPAQRVARTLQHAHARAVTAREDAQRQLSHLTHQHERAAAALHDAHAEEQALAAALAEHGAPTLAQVNEERRARDLAEFERLTAARAQGIDWAARIGRPEAGTLTVNVDAGPLTGPVDPPRPSSHSPRG